jgi:dephospho-CoA kinase
LSVVTWVVGLTGGIGSGKSAAADLFAAHGIAVIDTDAIAHELTAPGGAAMPAIRAGFGDGVVAADGALDRAAMRAIVFADPRRRSAWKPSCIR